MASVTPAEYFAAVGPVFLFGAGGGATSESSAAAAAADGANQSGQPEQSPRQQPHGHGRRASLATSAGSPTRTRTNASVVANNAAVPEAVPPVIDLAALEKATTARNCVHHPLEALDSLLPVTKDWRRFLKKAHALERIAWTGRGGLGTWEFGQKQGSSLARVEFRPTKPVLVGLGEGETTLSGGEQSPTRSRTRTASSSGGLGGPESSSYGWDGQTTSPASPYTSSSRRRSSSVSLAGSCLSNLSLSPTLQTVQRPAGGDGSHSVFSSPATPFSTLMGLGIPSSSSTAVAKPNGGDLPCLPPEYQHGFGNGNGGRRRSSASSNAMFGAIGTTFSSSASSPPQHDHSGGASSSALGLSMPLYEEENSLDASSAFSSSHVHDLFGWAADTAAATAPRAEQSGAATSPSGRGGGGGKGTSSSSNSKASTSYKSLPAIQTTAPPKASSLLPPAPAHLPAKPLSFAAAAASAAAAKVVNTSTTAGATAPAMVRTTSASSAISAAGGSSSKSAGSSPTQSPGRSQASGGSGGGGLKSGFGRNSGGGGGGGGRSNRSRGKSASPKQEKNASLPSASGAGTAGGENRRASGGAGGGAKKSGGGGGGRRREATR